MKEKKAVVKTLMSRENKENIETILERVGVSVAGAIRLFLNRVEEEENIDFIFVGKKKKTVPKRRVIKNSISEDEVNRRYEIYMKGLHEDFEELQKEQAGIK